MKQTRNAANACDRAGNKGFTWSELLILIVIGTFLLLLFVPEVCTVRDKARRVNCLSNQNGLWKAASQWGLNPRETWRPAFPNTNLASALFIDNSEVTPDIFLCPNVEIPVEGNWRRSSKERKNTLWGISPATNLASMRANNCNYAFFEGCTADDNAQILIADKDGSNNLPSATSWGGNHDGKGGNVIKVAGQGFWVSTLSESNDSIYSITDKGIMDAFATTGTVYTY